VIRPRAAPRRGRPAQDREGDGARTSTSVSSSTVSRKRTSRRRPPPWVSTRP